MVLGTEKGGVASLCDQAIWFLVEGRGKGLVNYLQLVGIHGISISQI